jgi:zona occludens toxin
MIYLTTGGNGSFKTCNTLWDVRQQQLAENRPVFYHGFDAGPVLTDQFGWKLFEPKKWQDLPDGSICIFDECQKYFPAHEKVVPDYIQAIAEVRRKRGFDFWMITPHPMLISIAIRRLVANPSWHRHNKRVAGSAMVSQCKWDTVNAMCEKPGSGDSGEVTMVPARKEAYGWYTSASMHTGKKKMPRAVWVMLACALAVPALGYFAVQRLLSGPSALKAVVEAKSAPGAGSAPVATGGGAPAAAGRAAPMTQAEYIAARIPRIEGLAWTAPAYDGVTQPAEAPYPAACVVFKGRCTCWTQQGTGLVVPDGICRQVVAHGFFMDWHKASTSRALPGLAPVPAAGSGAVRASGSPVAASAAVPAQLPASGAPAAPTQLYFPAVVESAIGVDVVDHARARDDGEMLARMRTAGARYR